MRVRSDRYSQGDVLRTADSDLSHVTIPGGRMALRALSNSGQGSCHGHVVATLDGVMTRRRRGRRTAWAAIGGLPFSE